MISFYRGIEVFLGVWKISMPLLAGSRKRFHWCAMSLIYNCLAMLVGVGFSPASNRFYLGLLVISRLFSRLWKSFRY